MKRPRRLTNTDLETIAEALKHYSATIHGSEGEDPLGELAEHVRSLKVRKPKGSHGFSFPGGLYRAQCVKIVDGDTLDVVLDWGLGGVSHPVRLRPLGINCSELNSSDPAERMKAQDAKAWCMEAIMHSPHAFVPSECWPLLVETYKTGKYGRWLAHVWFMASPTSSRIELKPGEVYHLNQELLDRGHAVPYE